jgi:hypothetical protein
MRRKIFILSAFSLIVLLSKAQDKPIDYRFHSINSLGLVNGSNDVSASLQSINGFQKKNWFLGIGVGLDYYYYRTAPVFADVRYSFGKKKNKFFAYADGGINIEWADDYFNNGVYVIRSSGFESHLENGYYTDAGFGYNIKMKKENALVLSLGFSKKTLSESVTYLDWRTQKPQTDINKYKLNRILLKVGWQF